MIKRGLLITLLVMVLAACSSDVTRPTVDDTHGRYELETINNRPMPFPLIVLLTYRLEFTESTLVLNDDQTWFEIGVVTEIIDNAITVVDSVYDFGTWSRANQTISLKNPDRGEELIGTLQAGMLVVPIQIDDSLYTYRYQKVPVGSLYSRSALSASSPSTLRRRTTTSSMTTGRSSITTSSASVLRTPRS